MSGYTHLLVILASFLLVEGQHANGNRQSLECFCLPPNQICDPTQVIPKTATRIEKFVDTRILNQNPESLCEQFRIPCCFGVPGQPIPRPNTGNGHSSSLQGCGARTSLNRRQSPGDADFGEYPWTALIVNSNDEFVATGALVSQSHIITAAHKIPKHAHNLLVRLGDYDISNEHDQRRYPLQTIPVAEVIVHRHYDSISLKNDLAILRLSRPVKYAQHINPVCLPEKNQRFQGNNRCYVSGWGKKGINGNYQAVMKEVDLPIVDSLICQDLLGTTKLTKHFILDPSFMCAGGIPGKDACEGDGGAPLVCDENGRGVVVGLVAWGQSCGTKIPGVYVNVAYFADFINQHIRSSHHG